MVGAAGELLARARDGQGEARCAHVKPVALGVAKWLGSREHRNTFLGLLKAAMDLLLWRV